MHETGCSGLVHWDDPEEWDGEGGGKEVHDGEHMYTHGWFMSVSQLVQSLSRVRLFETLWTGARKASLSISNSWSSLMSIESVTPSSHLILCCPLLLLPPIPRSNTVFSNESFLRMKWPKYWSYSFNISPSNEHPGLISFKMGWLDLLTVQGTLNCLLQQHSSKHQFFSTQLCSQSNSPIHTWPLEKP